FYVTGAPGDLITVLTFLRARLQTDYASQSSVAHAVVIRDNRARMALAESMIPGLIPGLTFSPPPALSPTAASNVLGHVLISDSHGTRTIIPSRAELQLSAARRFSFRRTDTAQNIFESIARAAGLSVIFDRDFRASDAVTFNLQNADPLDALDLLSL